MKPGSKRRAKEAAQRSSLTQQNGERLGHLRYLAGALETRLASPYIQMHFWKKTRLQVRLKEVRIQLDQLDPPERVQVR